MGDKTGIQWTDATWNPTRGCRRVSPGCENCYAERQANRMSSGAYKGLVALGKNGPRWTGKGRLVADLLDQPLRWKKPRRIFVDSMSDLFFEGFTNEEIAAVFGVVAAAPRHTFQVLTKRARRMREWFEWLAKNGDPDMAVQRVAWGALGEIERERFPLHRIKRTLLSHPWPLTNVWLGVSVEDQAHADERIPELLRVPAAVRFVSYEPALGPVDFRAVGKAGRGDDIDALTGWVTRYGYKPRSPSECGIDVACSRTLPALDWVIVGGESGPKARPFDIAWARGVVEQCKSAGVACFVKQLGRFPHHGDDGAGWAVSNFHGGHWRWDEGGNGSPLRAIHAQYDSHGGDWDEWPKDLRVREFPR